MSCWIYLVIGLFAGAFIGCIIMAVCNAAKDDDRDLKKL